VQDYRGPGVIQGTGVVKGYRSSTGVQGYRRSTGLKEYKYITVCRRAGVVQGFQ